MCNPSDDFCMMSFPYGDPKRNRSDDAGCRSLPNSYYSDDSEIKYGRKVCKNKNGFCKLCDDWERCTWSYRLDDDDKWRGATAMCRCKVLED